MGYGLTIERKINISKKIMNKTGSGSSLRCLDNHHWGEDGHYKEIILSHVLRQHLPKGISVGTGFVVNNGNITKQIDMMKPPQI